MVGFRKKVEKKKFSQIFARLFVMKNVGKNIGWIRIRAAVNSGDFL